MFFSPGKTMQIISFVDILLTHTVARSVLCIVPINTIQNWMAEFNFWLPAEEEEVTDHVSYHLNCTKIITIVLAYNRLRKRILSYLTVQILIKILSRVAKRIMREK